jgi:hypothetical protein
MRQALVALRRLLLPALVPAVAVALAAASVFFWQPTVGAQVSQSAPHKRALLIGVSKYARGVNAQEEWWDLSSEADITALHSLLAEKFGFQEPDIIALTTKDQTTRTSILAAFDKLIATTAKGDVVYIHYSGHGTPVPDKDGDEIDGLDESIVPSDYVSRKDGSRNIIDDTLGQLLDKLKAREPASVLITFDSCFSGSQTRGGRQVLRGGNFLDVAPARRGGDDTDVTGLGGREAFAKGYVVISAARSDQPASETDDGAGHSMGLLSYALVEQMRQAGPDTTYRDLFDGVLDTMTRRNPGQAPQLEGEFDTKLMNGAAAPPEPYFETRVDNNQLILRAGALHGVTAGSQFALYPRGTRTFNGTGVLAHAEVAAVRATEAVLKPMEAGDLERLRTARAVETAHKFSDIALRVDVSSLDALPRGAELRTEIEEFAKNRGLIKTTRGGDWDLKVCGNPCPDALRGQPQQRQRGETAAAMLIRQNGSEAAALPATADLPAALTRAIEAETRWQTLASLQRKDPRLQVEVRLVPVDATVDANGKVVSARRKAAAQRTKGGQPVFAIGDYFMVEVRNTGGIDAYVTIIDLSPDGSISPIYPHPQVGGQLQENKIRGAADPQKAEWVLIPFPYVFQVGPPAGNEIIKAIATDVPADFSALLTQSRTAGQSRGEVDAQKTPIGQLLSSVSRGTRGPNLATQPPDPTIWSTGSYTYVIPAAGTQ